MNFAQTIEFAKLRVSQLASRLAGTTKESRSAIDSLRAIAVFQQVQIAALMKALNALSVQTIGESANFVLEEVPGGIAGLDEDEDDVDDQPMPFRVVAGRLEGEDQERSYQYDNTFATLEEALEGEKLCKGCHFIDILFTDQAGKSWKVELFPTNV